MSELSFRRHQLFAASWAFYNPVLADPLMFVCFRHLYSLLTTKLLVFAGYFEFFDFLLHPVFSIDDPSSVSAVWALSIPITGLCHLVPFLYTVLTKMMVTSAHSFSILDQVSADGTNETGGVLIDVDSANGDGCKSSRR